METKKLSSTDEPSESEVFYNNCADCLCKCINTQCDFHQGSLHSLFRLLIFDIALFCFKYKMLTSWKMNEIYPACNTTIVKNHRKPRKNITQGKQSYDSFPLEY